MKAFQFIAKNEHGEKVTGTIESEIFDEATRAIRDQGLELVSLEKVEKVEKKIIDGLRPYIFEAIDKSGDEIQGTVQGKDIESVMRELKDDFGLNVIRLREKSGEVNSEEQKTVKIQTTDQGKNFRHPNEKSIDRPKKDNKSEPVLFSKNPKKDHNSIFRPFDPSTSSGLRAKGSGREKKKEVESEKQLNEIENALRHFLERKESLITDSTRERLRYLSGKIDLLRESPDKRRIRNLKRELKKAKKIAEREVKETEDRKWRDYEKKSSKNNISSYSEFEDEDEIGLGSKFKKKKSAENVFSMEKKNYTGLKKWLQTIDFPNEDKENEVLIKQQYESIWYEIGHFAEVLVIFYLLTFFLSYYLKRMGIEDHFLVRIYDTTIFKQIILFLFSFYSLIGVRNKFSTKRIISDMAFLVAWLVIIWWVLW